MLHGTMTRAAELLGMSQPGISTMIAGLERETGLNLFVRRGGRLQPTPEAKLFYVEAARTLEAVEGSTSTSPAASTSNSWLGLPLDAACAKRLLMWLDLVKRTRPRLRDSGW